jgi:hypothetical protein
VRLRDGSIDDAHLELLLVVDEVVGQRWIRLVRTLANMTYRLHRRALVTLLVVCYRLGPRRDA